MSVEVFYHPGWTLVGVKGPLRPNGDVIDKLQIPVLWQSLRHGLHAVTNRIGAERYSVITGDLSGNTEDAEYIACVAVMGEGRPPKGFVRIELAPGMVAKVHHTGSIHSLQETVKRVFVDWLPTSGFEVRANVELISYPPDYNMADPMSSFDYYVFVEKKA